VLRILGKVLTRAVAKRASKAAACYAAAMAGVVERWERGLAARGGKAGALNRGGPTGGDDGVTAPAVVRRTREGRPRMDRWVERRAFGQYGAGDARRVARRGLRASRGA
jgi:hypothetical protein